MKQHILTIIFLTSTFIVFAQKIEIKEVCCGYHYFQNEKKLTFKEMLSIIKIDNEAHQLMKSARSRNMVGGGIGFVSAIMLGGSIGKTISDGKPNWTVAGIGVGLNVVSLVLFSSANKKTIKAVDIYNANQTSLRNGFEPEFEIKFTSVGVGVVIRF